MPFIQEIDRVYHLDGSIEYKNAKGTNTNLSYYVKEDILKQFKENEDFMRDRINCGIEKNRKGNATIQFIDKCGKVVPDVHVEILQNNHEFKFGANIFMLDEFDTEEKNVLYRKHFKEILNLATLPVYWKSNEPKEGELRFKKDSSKIYRRPALDICMEYCRNNGIEPKAHCLNYDMYSPAWLKKDVADVKMKLDKRFKELAYHYAQQIPGWEVTNETLVIREGSAIYKEPDLVEWSFARARHYFPENKLIINEAGSNIWKVFMENRSQYYMQIERALLKGASIDVIGLQYHVFFQPESLYYDPVRMYKILDRYADFGKPLQITEVTIPCYSNTIEDEDIQAEIIKNVYSMWFSHEAMEAIIYWNLIDGYAAFATPGDMETGDNRYRGGLLRYDFSKKPAYNIMKKLIHEEWNTNESRISDNNGKVTFNGFYGDYVLKINTVDKAVEKALHFTKKGEHDYRITL